MNDLRIGTIRATATDWPAPDQLPEMIRNLADDRLDAALTARPLPEGEWCIRRLDVPVDLDPGRPLSALETDWADQIVAMLRQSLTDGSVDVVRYDRPEHAVDDLLQGLATRRYDHAWAWRQVGLVTTADPEPQDDASTLFLRVLARLPQGVAAAMARLLGRVGVTVAHRLLGRDGWAAVAALAAREAGIDWRPADATAPLTDAIAPTTRVSAMADPGTPDARSITAVADEPQAVPAATVRSGALARLFRGSALRVDRATLEAWAVLVLAVDTPSLLRRSGAAHGGLVAAIAEAVRPDAGQSGLGTTHASARTDRPATGGANGVRPAGADQAATPPAGATRLTGHSGSGAGDGSGGPDEVDRPVSPGTPPDATRQDAAADQSSSATRWGGLLFLLNTVSAAGLPEILDEPPLLARPASWVLHRLGRTLVPADADDPAVLALAGLTAPPPGNPAEAAETAALASCAERWASATAALLRVDDDTRGDLAIVRDLAGRRATIRHEPGWVEVWLSLDDVDLDVRRAGLDLDPGWLWWLGQVVRFRYE